jgi:CRISPR-associated endonuclease/helicase Cas3
VDRADFAKFFGALNAGCLPFRWQERLLDALLDNGRWPERITAPTGAGKTSAIDVHVFAVALTAGRGPRLPRRLAMVVDRRVLVDDQYRRARKLAGELAAPADDIVAEVAARLAGLRWPRDPGDERPRGGPAGESPLVTARLRGGMIPSRSWRDSPGACAVLCATPDMWGSRLLFGGYGTSSPAAPREAGLLAFDSAVVVDEAHLAGQLLVTARQVAKLATAADQPLPGVPALQVVEVSATPAHSGTRTSVAVEEDDLADDSPLADRLTRPKPVTLIPVAGWPAPGKPGPAAMAAADAAEKMLARVTAQDGAARTVGCFVNTVPMAVAVTGLLRARKADGRGLRVVMICGQVRPADLATLEDRYPGILTPAGSPEVDVIVGTQSLEVGVDLDLAGIVTELAAGTALAQRAGRANRRGLRPAAPVVVLVPAEPLTGRSRSGPYTSAELTAALEWATRLAGREAGIAPWAIREDRPPDAGARRLLRQRPELADAWHWARTSEELAAEPELDLWLAESLEDETSIGIIVRDAMPADPADAVDLVRVLPPAPWEAFPVPFRTARDVLTELLSASQAAAGSPGPGNEDLPQPVAVRVRGEDTAPLGLRINGDGIPVAAVRPGDFVVLDSTAQIFTPQPPGGFSPPVVAAAPSDPDSPGLQDRAVAEDVLHFPSAIRDGNLLFRLEASPQHAQVAGVSQADGSAALALIAGNPESGEAELRDLLAAAFRALSPPPASGQHTAALAGRVAGLLGGKVKDSDVILQPAGNPARVIVTDRRRPAADDDLLQVLSPARYPVTLASHQAAVAGRARLLASQAGLSDEFAASLHAAGAHHDDGKADTRFQKYRLGLPEGHDVLAKSLPGVTVRQVRAAEGLGLPAGWRHEQRSVADCWDQVQAEPGIDPQLALRLVGTSHGRGRSSFPHTGRQLDGDNDTHPWRERASALFDEGAWEELIEVTQLRYGPWGCAYLEALLRAADCQISGEGR